MICHSSLTSIRLAFFRSSLLFVALFPTFHAHSSSPLPLLSLLVSSSFLFWSTVFICKKMSSHDHERILQLQPTKKRVQNGKSDPFLDSSQVSDFAMSGSFESFLDEEVESEEVEEDYLIEIPLLSELNLAPRLISDMNDMSGEDNLIEIDISMGSIRS